MARKFLPKAALVTGGAQRIGRAICQRLAALGYRVALHYHQSAAAARKTQETIQKKGGVCEIFSCDLTDTTAVARLFHSVHQKFPSLNVLVNNASFFEPSDLKNFDLKSFERHVSLHLAAPYILSGLFAKFCEEGCIINLLDTHITEQRTSHFDYLLSKKALASFTQLAATALAPHIRVNAVAPGLILPPLGKPKNYLNRLARTIPLQRNGNVDDVLHAMQFLLENPYVTGQIIFVDGGESI